MPFQCPAWPPDWPEIETAALAAINSGQWGQYHSTLTQSLQKRLASELPCAAVRLCCSGTAALELALRCCQIGPGDEVILAAYDFPGNFRTVELLGAKPVLVDVAQFKSGALDKGERTVPGGHDDNVDEAMISPTLCHEQLSAAAGEQVRAVVASHLHGSFAEIAHLRQICDQHGWTLIEDACQAIGGRLQNQSAGSFGHLATLSFGGSKLVSAGSGGAILANDTRLAARLGGLLDRPGDTFPLAPLQAAVIGPQLDQLDQWTCHRIRVAQFLRQTVFPTLQGWVPLCDPNIHVQGEVHDPPSAGRLMKGTDSSSNGDLNAYYKFAWLVPSERRDEVIAAGLNLGLPLGAGFRSMSRCSSRRCRKPVRTPRADLLGERLIVMDHRALLIPAERFDELAQALRELHRITH